MAKLNYYDYESPRHSGEDYSVFRAGYRVDCVAVYHSRSRAIAACRGLNLDLLHQGALICPDYVRLEFGLPPASAA